MAQADKTNEHKAGLRLVEQLLLTGCIVTADAMFTHRDFCQAVRGRGGQSLAFVKENQPMLRRDIEAASASPAREALAPLGGTCGRKRLTRSRPAARATGAVRCGGCGRRRRWRGTWTGRTWHRWVGWKPR